jgi:hypothetical protein
VNKKLEHPSVAATKKKTFLQGGKKKEKHNNKNSTPQHKIMYFHKNISMQKDLFSLAVPSACDCNSSVDWLLLAVS